MIIYSKPSASVPFRVDLPELPRDYWQPEAKILEAETIATSATKAAMFRQLVKFDVTSITRRYVAILSAAKAAYLLLMAASDQTSFIVNTGTGTYEVMMLIEPTAMNPQQTRMAFRFSVLAAVS